MLLRYFLLLLSTLILNADANLNPRAPAYPQTNTTTTKSSTSSAIDRTPSASVPHLQAAASPNPDHVCCFVVQDVVSEEWWDIVKTSSIYTVVNRTQITAHLTPYPTTTITNYEYHVQTTNASFPVTAQIGVNPISLFGNGAPLPTQVAQSNNGTALITGGITVQSPAAFYIYSTLKVITAAAITDGAGNLACGTSIGGFPNLNPNAQAYFGGPKIDQASPSPIDPRFNPRALPATPVVISLTTPFIYQPARGKLGATGINSCGESAVPGTEDYGYVPQTVLDYLIGNQGYSAQYPGLSSCLPAGPSIIPSGCGVVETFTTTFTTTPPVSTSTGVSTSIVFFNSTITIPASTVVSTVSVSITSTLSSVIAPSTIGGGSTIEVPFTTAINGTGSIGTNTITIPGTQQTVAASTFLSTAVFVTPSAITQILPESTAFDLQSSAIPEPFIQVISSPPSVVTSVGFLTVAAVQTAAPPSYVTSDVGTDITDPVVISVATPPPGQLPIAIQSQPGQNVPGQTPPGQNPPAQTPPGSNQIASAICQVIGCATGPPANTPVQIGQDSTGVGVIVSPTTIPLSAAPPGLPGVISTIDGTPVLIITSPVTFAPFNPTPDPISGARVTIINGAPSVVIDSSTLIPVVNAPPQLSNAPTTIINNTPFLVVGPTTFPAPSPQANGPITTNIQGTDFIVFPSATNIPLSNAPPGLTGSLTIINNTPFIVVPGATNIPMQATQTGTLATTVINGTPFVVVSNPTQIPLVNAPPGLNGVTTTISGTPFLIIPSATTLPLPTSPPNIPGAITTVINNTPFLIFPSATTLPLSLGSGIPGAITTIIDGSPVVIIPKPTTVLEPNAQITSIPGLVTVINGVTEVIFTGLVTVPVNSAFSLSGLTTVISGITEVILSTPTTISLKTSPSSTSTTLSTTSTSSSQSSTSSSTSSRSSSSSRTSSTVSTSSTQSPTVLPSNSNSHKGLSTGAKVGIAFAVIIFVLLVAGLILFLIRRRQDREQYAPVAASGDGAGAPPVVEQLRTSTQIGADNYTPVVRTRGGYVPASQQEWMSTMRRENSIARRPVGA